MPFDPLGGSAIVADDHIDQGVVENAEIFQCFEYPPYVKIRVLQEAGIDLHFASQYRLHFGIDFIPRLNSAGPPRQIRIPRNNAHLFLPGEDLLAQLVPPLIELAPVTFRPFFGHVMRSVTGSWSKVRKEGFIRHQRFLLPDPGDRLVGHVFGEVIALFRGFWRLNGRGAFVDCGIVLVGFAADKAVEVFKAAATCGPLVEGAHWAGLPCRHFVALAELRCGVTVQLEGHRQRGFVLRQNRVIAGRGAGNFSNAAHPNRMMITAREQRLPGGRAERGGVEAVVPESACGQHLEAGRLAWSAESARGAETNIIEKNNEYIGRALGRPQRFYGWKRSFGIFCIVGGQACMWPIRNGENRSRRRLRFTRAHRSGHDCLWMPGFVAYDLSAIATVVRVEGDS